MKNELTAKLKIKFDVDYETADMCLKIVNIYLNQTQDTMVDWWYVSEEDGTKTHGLAFKKIFD